jgi:hypothetical protein
MGAGATSFLVVVNFLLGPLGGAGAVLPPALSHTAAVSASDAEHLAYECKPGHLYTVSPYAGGEPKGWPGAKCEKKGSAAVCTKELPGEYDRCVVYYCNEENAQDCTPVSGEKSVVGRMGVNDIQRRFGVDASAVDSALNADIGRAMQDVRRAQDLAFVNPNRLDFKSTVLADPIPRVDINAPSFTPDTGMQIERYAGTPESLADRPSPTAFDARVFAADARALGTSPSVRETSYVQEVPARTEATFDAPQDAEPAISPTSVAHEREGYFSNTLQGADAFVRRNFDIKKWAGGVNDFRGYLKEKFPTLRSWLSE